MNPYKVLNIKKDASASDIKNAYRKLSKELHPDVNNGDDKGFIKLNLAYRVLSDADKRRLYDEQGIVMDDDPNHIDNLIKNRMADIANHWLENMLKGQKINIQKFFMLQIDNAVKQIKERNLEIDNLLLQLDNIYERLTYKEENSIVHNIIKQRIKTYKRGKLQNTQELNIIEKLKKVIQDYDYEDEELYTILDSIGTNASTVGSFTYTVSR